MLVLSVAVLTLGASYVLLPMILELAWNVAMVPLVHAPPVTFLESVGIVVVLSIVGTLLLPLGA